MQSDSWAMIYHYVSGNNTTYLCYEGTLQDITEQIISLKRAGFYIDTVRYMGDDYFS